MEYNKKRITKLNDRKILHKVKKHWIVISLALLGVIGGGAMTHIGASANVAPVNSTNDLNRQTDATSANQDVTLTSSHFKSSTSSQQFTSSSPAFVSQQATNLHDHILARAAMSQNTGLNNSSDMNSHISSRPTQQEFLTNPIPVQSSRAPQVQTEKWGQTQIKFVSDGDHGNDGGDVAIVEPGAISDAFYEQNNSDTTYNSDHSNGVTGCYIVNRYNDDLQLPFDQTSNNWSLKFAPGVFLPKDDGVSKNDQVPKNGESSSDVNYTQNAVKTNDYRYLFSSTNRSLWNHFKTMDLTNLNTDNAEDLSNMFTGDQSLQKVILNDSANPKLTELHGMFADDPQLREVNFNHFNTESVTNLDSMFMSDVRLQHLDLGNLDTRNVTNMHAMFMSDLTLSDIQGIDQLNTGRVINMISMFSRDRSLPRLSLNHWNTLNVTSMAEMFSGDANLRDLDLSGFDTRRVSDMSGMFTQDSQLRMLNLANFDTRNVHAIFPGIPTGGMSFMFSGDDQLDKLTLGQHTNLNGPNQNWGPAFFDQICDVNDNDATKILKAGRQPAGIYYATDYYNHVLLVQRYFTDESQAADQVLSNTSVQKDPQARARVRQVVSQANGIEKSADAKLNTASVNSQVLDDMNSVSNLTRVASNQISSATQWVASSVASSAASLSNYRSRVARSVASSSASASRSASISTSASLSASTAASLKSSKTSSENAIANDLAKKQLSSYVSELTTDDQMIVDHDDQAIKSLDSLRSSNHDVQSADFNDISRIQNDRNTVNSNETSVKANVSSLESQRSTALGPLIANVKNEVNSTSNYSQQNGSILDHDVNSLISMSNSVSVSISTSASSANASKSASLSQSASLSNSINASKSVSMNQSLSNASTSASLSAKTSASVSTSVKASLSQSTEIFNRSVNASLSASTSVSASNSVLASLSRSKSLSTSASIAVSNNRFKSSVSASLRNRAASVEASLNSAKQSKSASTNVNSLDNNSNAVFSALVASLNQSTETSRDASLLPNNNQEILDRRSSTADNSNLNHSVNPNRSSFSDARSNLRSSNLSSNFNTSRSSGINSQLKSSYQTSRINRPEGNKEDLSTDYSSTTDSSVTNQSKGQASASSHRNNYVNPDNSNVTKTYSVGRNTMKNSHQQSNSNNNSHLPQTNEESRKDLIATILLLISTSSAAINMLIDKNKPGENL